MSPKYNTQAKQFDNEIELNSMRKVLTDIELQIIAVEIDMANRNSTLESLKTRKQRQLKKLMDFEKTYGILQTQRQDLFDAMRELQQNSKNGVIN